METHSPTELGQASPSAPHSRDWFIKARYGLFVHWGLYSLLGRGEWVRNRERIPDHEYVQLANQFYVSEFDPRALARLAKGAGMKYGVLTSKHHDGFSLWNSKANPFNSVNASCRRDLLGEFLEAFRSAGLRVGVYYSLGDWHQPDWYGAVQGDEASRRRFVDYTRDLIHELATEYGKLDVFWYDLPQGLTAEQWESRETNAMIRSLQPGILINNRSMLPEDFSISERSLHGAPPGRLWESCLTFNESWAYVEGDHDYKTARQVCVALGKAAGGGGNLLLNVGPDGRGRVPERCEEVLREVGAWLERNGEAVYGTSGEGLPFNLWGPSSAAGQTMYLFLERYFGSELVVGGLTSPAVSASILSTGQQLTIEKRDSRTILGGLPPDSPDPLLTVVKLVLDGPPDQDTSRVISGADIMASFPD